IIGTPLYLDGYAALPFVRGLMDRGMAEGAAMAFLIAGGITSAWTALPVLSLFRLPVFLTYMLLAVSGAMLSGWVYGLSIA
ncbi:MAG: permease, partial [Pseudomonadota bacterium]